MGRKKNYQRETVLNEAMRCFLLKGFAATSLQDLGAATGLNRKSLYAEFGSKETLFQEAIDHYTRAVGRQAGHLLARQPLGNHNIVAFFEALIQSPELRGCLFTLITNERHVVSQEAFGLVERAYRRLAQAFAANLQASESAVPARQAALLSRYLIMAMQGLTTSSRMGMTEHERQQMVQLLLWPLRQGPGQDALDAQAEFLENVIGVTS